jgi:hypothetical protein
MDGLELNYIGKVVAKNVIDVSMQLCHPQWHSTLLKM